MKNVLKSLVVLTVVGAMVANSTLAAFTAQATIHSSTFAAGNAALRFLVDLNGPATGNNIVPDIQTGPVFSNIYPTWTADYPIKLTNAGTVNLVVSANSVLGSDTSNMGSQIYVQAFAWHDDVVANGLVDPGELGSEYTSGPTLTLADWANPANAINFPGQLNVGQVMPVVLRFSTNDAFSDTFQFQTAIYDFQFNGTTTGASPVVGTPTPTP